MSKGTKPLPESHVALEINDAVEIRKWSRLTASPVLCLEGFESSVDACWTDPQQLFMT